MALLTFCLVSLPPMVKSDKEAYKIGIDICRSWYKETPNYLGALTRSGKEMIEKGKGWEDG